ncbi:MAG: transglutaminase domain-containing protein [Mucilaginibacter sp.]
MTKFSTFLKAGALLFFVFCGNQLFAQNTLKNAWQAFFENKRNEAKTLFTQGANQKETAEEASLGLSFVADQEGDPVEAFNYFKKFYSQNKNPQPYLFALWNTSSINETFGKKSEQQLDFLRQLTQQKDYDGTIAAMAYSMIGKHFDKSKNTTAADKEFANQGSIDNWAISPEFENISTSGFDKEYKTLLQPEDNATFTNKKGVDVAWHTVPYIRHDKWFDFTYYANAYSSIIFAQSFINSAAEQEAQLRIGVSGSVKVWVNDRQILSEPEERNNDLDAYIQTIKLHKGYNRVLIQIGESYAGNSNFLVRITDDKGHVLTGLTQSPKYHQYEKETNYVSKKIELPAIVYFEDQVKKNPQDMLAKILLAHTYLTIDKTFEARKIIEPLLKIYPQSTYLNEMLLELFSKSKNKTGLQTVQETIKMSDPESSMALTLRFNELVEQQAYEKAADLIKSVEQLYASRKEFIYTGKIKLANLNKNQDEVIKYADEAYKLFPDNEDFTVYQYLIALNLKKDLPKAIELLKKYNETNDDYTVAKELAADYFKSGNPEAGFKVYKDQIAHNQVGVGIYDQLGNNYYEQQMYDKAAECFLSCINIAPTIGKYYTELAKVYEQTNQKDKAIQYYQTGLKYNPSNYETIKALRKVEGKKEVFSYFDEPNIAEIIKTAPKASDYPDDSYIVLDDEVQKVVYENGGSEDKRYMVAKILNQKGIETWKEYELDVNNDQNYLIETAEVIKANGNKIPAERNNNNLVFTNLEIGDIINIRYKLENYFNGKLASHFWDSFYFTSGHPSANLKYSLLIDKSKKFTYKFSGQTIEPEKSGKDEFDMYVWKSNNAKSINYEDKMPSFDDVANGLYLTSIPDWKFVADWYNDIATAKARTNYEIKSVIGDLFEGKSNLTDMKKVEKIYDYITDNITYSSVSFRQSGIVPQNPADVINTRIGDCKDVATLFVAMCKEAGITAQLVLVKTRNNGLHGMPLPTIDFNHCIAKVNLNNREYYIELTSKYLPFQSIYNQSLNSSILDIGDKEPAAIKYLNPATRKQNSVSRNVTVGFRNKDLIVNENLFETAARSAILRDVYKDLSAKDQLKKKKEELSAEYPDNEITQLTFANLNKVTADTVSMRMDYELKNAAKEIAGLLIFSLPWSDKFVPSDFQITLPRLTGLDVSQMFSMDNESETIVVSLPAGKKIVEMPAPVNLNNDIIDFSIVPKMDHNKIVLTRTVKVKKDYIPADRVPEFSNFFKKIVDADNKELAMK